MSNTTPKLRKRKPRGGSSCGCIKAVNEQLREKGVHIRQEWVFNKRTVDMSPPIIVLDKLDPKSRVKIPTLMCSFCPFCGQEYKGVR